MWCSRERRGHKHCTGVPVIHAAEGPGRTKHTPPSPTTPMLPQLLRRSLPLSLLLLILLLLLTPILSHVSAATVVQSDERPSSSSLDSLTTEQITSLLDRTLSALTRAMKFFIRVHRIANLDAIIGTRIVADQFTVLLSRLNNGSESLHKTSRHYRHLVDDIQKMAERLSDMSIKHIAHNYPYYYAKIGKLLEKHFWEIDHVTRPLNMDLVSSLPIQPGEEQLKESISDDCIAELLGTRPHATGTCQVSDLCWTLMTGPGYSGYSLSHELFYLQIGQQAGCTKALAAKAVRFNKFPLDTLSGSFCSSMWLEANNQSRHGYSPASNDLFMEQIGLCGMQGYYQFAEAAWLKHILSWQSQDGCYRGWPLEFITQDQHSRQKREEKILDDGCMCHRTTVASIALSQFTRYLLENLGERVRISPTADKANESTLW